VSGRERAGPQARRNPEAQTAEGVRITARFVSDIWYARTPGIAARLLVPLSWIFGAVAAVRRAAFASGVLRRVRVGVPVVVVGNVTVGGTGKTPLVAALVEALRERGRRPGIVSRGYGRRTHDVRAVARGADVHDVGDEPLLLAHLGIPVFVGRDRVAAARSLLAAHPGVDVIVSDDGLQHYRLARDVEIVVVDAARGLGNGRLLPAGPLREPASRLASADAIVWRNGDASSHGPREFAMTYDAKAWTNLVDPARAFDPAALADPSAIAIAGIGDPGAFFGALRAAGFRGRTFAFADHHAFTRGDVAFPGATAILMTEKDAVKCDAFRDARMWMRPVRARIDPALVDLVQERIDGPEASRNARVSRDEGSAHL
jgi:tetraacyldisaccharide 4'-kinase